MFFLIFLGFPCTKEVNLGCGISVVEGKERRDAMGDGVFCVSLNCPNRISVGDRDGGARS